MKKISLFITLLFLLTLTGCSSKLNTRESVYTNVNSDNLITMSINLDEDNLYLSIKNNSNIEVYYTADWYLEKYDKKWFQYDIELTWNEMLYVLDSNETKEFIIPISDIENMYEKLENGKYRIVKYINNNYYTAEFNIK